MPTGLNMMTAGSGTGSVDLPAYVPGNPSLPITTPDQKELYSATMEFERFFVSQLVSQMNKSTEAIGGSDAAAEFGGSTDGYKDLAQDQMVEAMLDGGGLGIAAVMYEQIGRQTGVIADAGIAPVTHDDPIPGGDLAHGDGVTGSGATFHDDPAPGDSSGGGA